MLRRDSAANAHLFASTVLRFAALLAAMAALAGCESNASPPPGPYNVVSKYLSQIAEGNYSNACGMLDTGVRDALIKRMGSRTTCSKLFVQCLPSNATNISRDQAQLLYATIQVTTHHHKSDVTVAGTAVARAIKRVTLAKEQGTWKLTSYGDALRRCPREKHHLRAARRSPKATVG